MSLGLALKEKLERKFGLILGIQNEADFFLEVCNYLYFIASDLRLRHIVSEILREREHAHETYNKLQQEALHGLRGIRKGLDDLLRQYDISEDESKSLFEKFDNLNDGKIQTSSPLWSALEDDLYSILTNIDKKYPKVKLDRFAVRDEHSNITLTSPLEEIIRKCSEEFELLKLMRRTAIWGVWDRLLLVYQAAYTSDRELREKYRQNPLEGMGLALVVGEMRDIIRGAPTMSTFSELKKDRRDECLLDLRRLHNFILDHLDKTSLGFTLLRKYKQRCEWYDREELLKLTKKQTDQTRNKAEECLTRQLARYLHDNGVIPLSQVNFGRARPDLLGLYSGEELFPIEVKAVNLNEIERVRRGFNQILEYLRTINIGEGFYVIFCRGDFTLDIPNAIFVNNQRINIVTIELFETPPSRRSPQIWRITQVDLIP